VFFGVDIFINFNTSYVDHETEMLVVRRRKIAMHYLQTWFLIDFFSTFPFDLILRSHSANTLAAVRLVRVVRLVRIVKLYQKLTQSKFWRDNSPISPGAFSLGMLIMQIFYVTHLFACFWHYIGSIDDGYPTTWRKTFDFQDHQSTIGQRYVVSVYYVLITMATIGYGDIHPTNDLERMFGVITILTGVIVLSALVNRVTSVLNSINPLSSSYAQQLEQMKQGLMGLRLPFYLRKQAKKAYGYYLTKRTTFGDDTVYYHHLPSSTLTKLLQHIFHDEIYSIALFQEYFTKRLDAELSFFVTILPQLSPAYAKPLDLLYCEGDIMKELCFIREGRVILELHDGWSNVCVGTVSQGQYFGDVEMFRKSSTALVTYRAAVYVQLWTLPQQVWNDAAQKHGFVSDVMMKDDKRRKSILHRTDSTDDRDRDRRQRTEETTAAHGTMQRETSASSSSSSSSSSTKVNTSDSMKARKEDALDTAPVHQLYVPMSLTEQFQYRSKLRSANLHAVMKMKTEFIRALYAGTGKNTSSEVTGMVKGAIIAREPAPRMFLPHHEQQLQLMRQQQWKQNEKWRRMRERRQRLLAVTDRLFLSCCLPRSTCPHHHHHHPHESGPGRSLEDTRANYQRRQEEKVSHIYLPPSEYLPSPLSMASASVNTNDVAVTPTPQSPIPERQSSLQRGFFPGVDTAAMSSKYSPVLSTSSPVRIEMIGGPPSLLPPSNAQDNAPSSSPATTRPRKASYLFPVASPANPRKKANAIHPPRSRPPSHGTVLMAWIDGDMQEMTQWLQSMVKENDLVWNLTWTSLYEQDISLLRLQQQQAQQKQQAQQQAQQQHPAASQSSVSPPRHHRSVYDLFSSGFDPMTSPGASSVDNLKARQHQAGPSSPDTVKQQQPQQQQQHLLPAHILQSHSQRAKLALSTHRFTQTQALGQKDRILGIVYDYPDNTLVHSRHHSHSHHHHPHHPSHRHPSSSSMSDAVWRRFSRWFGWRSDRDHDGENGKAHDNANPAQVDSPARGKDTPVKPLPRHDHDRSRSRADSEVVGVLNAQQGYTVVHQDRPTSSKLTRTKTLVLRDVKTILQQHQTTNDNDSDSDTSGSVSRSRQQQQQHRQLRASTKYQLAPRLHQSTSPLKSSMYQLPAQERKYSLMQNQDEALHGGSVRSSTNEPHSTSQRRHHHHRPHKTQKLCIFTHEELWKRYLLHPEGVWRSYWDLLTGLLIFYSVIVIPVQVAFVEFGKRNYEYFVDAVFLFDILINFHTIVPVHNAYLKPHLTAVPSNNKMASSTQTFSSSSADANEFVATETEATTTGAAAGASTLQSSLLKTSNISEAYFVSRRLIALNYLLSPWFLVDLLSSLPFDLMLAGRRHAESVSLVRMIRVFRLLRLLKIFRATRLKEAVESIEELFSIPPSLVALFFLLFQVYFVGHLLACLWWGLTNVMAEEYAPFQDHGSGWFNFVDRHGLRYKGVSVGSQYLASVYFTFTTLTTVGYGDITPHYTAERLLCVGMALCGLVLFGYIMASVSQLLQSLASTTSLSRQVAKVSDFLHERHCPVELEKEILHQYRRKIKDAETDELEAMLACLPLRIALPIRDELHAKRTRTVAFYPYIPSPSVALYLFSQLKPVLVDVDYDICREDTTCSNVSFLTYGRAVIYRRMTDAELLRFYYQTVDLQDIDFVVRTQRLAILFQYLRRRRDHRRAVRRRRLDRVAHPGENAIVAVRSASSSSALLSPRHVPVRPSSFVVPVAPPSDGDDAKDGKDGGDDDIADTRRRRQHSPRPPLLLPSDAAASTTKSDTKSDTTGLLRGQSPRGGRRWIDEETDFVSVVEAPVTALVLTDTGMQTKHVTLAEVRRELVRHQRTLTKLHRQRLCKLFNLDESTLLSEDDRGGGSDDDDDDFDDDSDDADDDASDIDEHRHPRRHRRRRRQQRTSNIARRGSQVNNVNVNNNENNINENINENNVNDIDNDASSLASSHEEGDHIDSGNESANGNDDEEAKRSEVSRRDSADDLYDPIAAFIPELRKSASRSTFDHPLRATSSSASSSVSSILQSVRQFVGATLLGRDPSSENEAPSSSSSSSSSSSPPFVSFDKLFNEHAHLLESGEVELFRALSYAQKRRIGDLTERDFNWAGLVRICEALPGHFVGHNAFFASVHGGTIDIDAASPGASSSSSSSSSVPKPTTTNTYTASSPSSISHDADAIRDAKDAYETKVGIEEEENDDNDDIGNDNEEAWSRRSRRRRRQRSERSSARSMNTPTEPSSTSIRALSEVKHHFTMRATQISTVYQLSRETLEALVARETDVAMQVQSALAQAALAQTMELGQRRLHERINAFFRECCAYYRIVHHKRRLQVIQWQEHVARAASAASSSSMSSFVAVDSGPDIVVGPAPESSMRWRFLARKLSENVLRQQQQPQPSASDALHHHDHDHHQHRRHRHATFVDWLPVLLESVQSVQDADAKMHLGRQYSSHIHASSSSSSSTSSPHRSEDASHGGGSFLASLRNVLTMQQQQGTRRPARRKSTLGVTQYRRTSPVLFQRDVEQRVLALQHFFETHRAAYIEYLYGEMDATTTASSSSSSSSNAATAEGAATSPRRRRRPTTTASSSTTRTTTTTTMRPRTTTTTMKRTRSYSDSELDVTTLFRPATFATTFAFSTTNNNNNNDDEQQRRRPTTKARPPPPPPPPSDTTDAGTGTGMGTGAPEIASRATVADVNDNDNKEVDAVSRSEATTTTTTTTKHPPAHVTFTPHRAESAMIVPTVAPDGTSAASPSPSMSTTPTPLHVVGHAMTMTGATLLRHQLRDQFHEHMQQHLSKQQQNQQNQLFHHQHSSPHVHVGQTTNTTMNTNTTNMNGHSIASSSSSTSLRVGNLSLDIPFFRSSSRTVVDANSANNANNANAVDGDGDGEDGVRAQQARREPLRRRRSDVSHLSVRRYVQERLHPHLPAPSSASSSSSSSSSTQPQPSSSPSPQLHRDDWGVPHFFASSLAKPSKARFPTMMMAKTPTPATTTAIAATTDTADEGVIRMRRKSFSSPNLLLMDLVATSHRSVKQPTSTSLPVASLSSSLSSMPPPPMQNASGSSFEIETTDDGGRVRRDPSASAVRIHHEPNAVAAAVAAEIPALSTGNRDALVVDGHRNESAAQQPQPQPSPATHSIHTINTILINNNNNNTNNNNDNNNSINSNSNNSNNNAPPVPPTPRYFAGRATSRRKSTDIVYAQQGLHSHRHRKRSFSFPAYDLALWLTQTMEDAVV
jgi:CRP-like cAMP-binding protein